MAYYYINRNAQSFPENGEHEVHRSDRNCPKPLLPENRIGLGEFDNCTSALATARIKFPHWRIDGCKHCNIECHKI